MYNANEVSPGKWQNHIVVYDDGAYSAIWGNYSGSQYKSLGVRWNGGANDNGYPTQGGNPLWYVEPELVSEAILRQLRTVVTSLDYSRSLRQYLPLIDQALQELRITYIPKTSLGVEL